MCYDGFTNQPPEANSAFHPSGVGKWVPASAGKAKADMVHSVSGWTRGVQVKLWVRRTRAIPERLRGVFTTRRCTNPRLPYLTLPLHMIREESRRLWLGEERLSWVEELPDTVTLVRTFRTFRYCVHISIASFWLRHATNYDSQPIQYTIIRFLQKQYEYCYA